MSCRLLTYASLSFLIDFFTASRNRRFQFHKRSQFFIGAHNVTLSVTVRVSNPDCSPNTKSDSVGCAEGACFGEHHCALFAHHSLQEWE